MCIAALQRVEGPSHLVNTDGQRALPLRLLQARSQVQVAVGIENGEHVRVDGRHPVFASQKSEREANELFPIGLVLPDLLLVKSTDKNIAQIGRASCRERV